MGFRSWESEIVIVKICQSCSWKLLILDDLKIKKDEINIGTSGVLKKVKDAITTLEEKTNKVFFFCMDSKGTPMASVATIYEHAKILKEAGYNPVILHEKNDIDARPLYIFFSADILTCHSRKGTGVINSIN